MRQSFLARPVAAATTVALLLGGCSSAWPTLESDVRKDSQGKITGMHGDDAIANASLNDALQYAYVTLDELSTGNQNAGGLTRGTSYLATALGVAAGATVLFTVSDVVLKGLTLAGGSLLGAYGVANPEAQRKIYTAGEDAMVCVIGAANAYRAAARNLSTSFASLYQSNLTFQALTNTSVNTARTQMFAENVYKLRPTSQDLIAMPIAIASHLPPPLTLTAKADDSAAFQTAQKNVAAYNNLRQKTFELLTDFAGKLSDQPRHVVQSTWLVRAKVRQQLAATAPDPSTIIDARRDAIVTSNADLAAKVKAARDAAKKAPDTGETGGAGAAPPPADGNKVISKMGVRGPSLAVGRLGAAAATTDTTAAIAIMQLIAKITADAVKPVEEVYKACIDKATVAAQDAGEEGDK